MQQCSCACSAAWIWSSPARHTAASSLHCTRQHAAVVAAAGCCLPIGGCAAACPQNTPALQVGSFRDPEAVREFAKGCDVLTVEIEHIDADAMQARWGLWQCAVRAGREQARRFSQMQLDVHVGCSYGSATAALPVRAQPRQSRADSCCCCCCLAAQPWTALVPVRRQWPSSRVWRCSPRRTPCASSRCVLQQVFLLHGLAMSLARCADRLGVLHGPAMALAWQQQHYARSAAAAAAQAPIQRWLRRPVPLHPSTLNLPSPP